MRSFVVAAAVGGLFAYACHASPPAPEEARAPLVPEPFGVGDVQRILALSPLPEPPPDPTNRVYEDEGAARLGQYLFFDERLSKDGRTSCATCHDPGLSWTDGLSLAEGVTPLERQTMTLWNVAYNRWFFWDGRADSLWSQALTPLEHPLEHAGSRLQYAHVVHDDPELRHAYETVFDPLPELSDEGRFPAAGRPVPAGEDSHDEQEGKPAPEAAGHSHGPGAHFYHPHQRAWDAMTPADQEAVTRVFTNLGKALAAYQRKIVSRRAPFDVFVEGLREGDADKQAALPPPARRGLELFLGKARCHICHSGPTFSDREFHDVRVPPLDGGEARDPGRRRGLELVAQSPFKGTGPWSDDPGGAAEVKVGYLPQHLHGGGEFKTPTLRNVALTPPYMHQGQFATLEEVVRYYSELDRAISDPPPLEKILVPLHLDDGEIADLIAFLVSLTDDGLDPGLKRQPLSPRLDTTDR